MTNPPHDFKLLVRNLQAASLYSLLRPAIGGVIGAAVYWDSSK
jgi:hypothetical protein